MKNMQHRAEGHGHTASGGTGSSHIPDGHVHDHKNYRDLNFRAINQFMIGLIAIVAVSYISMYGMLKLFESNHERNDPAPSPVAVSGWNNPGPEVQASPHVDLTNYLDRVDSTLEGETGTSMPIEEAMKAVVSQGLPFKVMTAEDSARVESSAVSTENAETTPANPDSASTQ